MHRSSYGNMVYASIVCYERHREPQAASRDRYVNYAPSWKRKSPFDSLSVALILDRSYWERTLISSLLERKIIHHTLCSMYLTAVTETKLTLQIYFQNLVIPAILLLRRALKNHSKNSYVPFYFIMHLIFPSALSDLFALPLSLTL